jgi:hypothetical protein
MWESHNAGRGQKNGKAVHPREASASLLSYRFNEPVAAAMLSGSSG